MAKGSRGLIVIVVVILTVGIGGTLAISNAFRSEARLGWEQEAANTAQSLSGTLLGWLEESYAPLSGLAAISENSDNLTETEFLNAYDGLEARATAIFLETAALAEFVSGEGWRIRYSSDPNGVLSIDKPLGELPELLEAVLVAEDRFGEMILGHPLSKNTEKETVSPVVLSAYGGAGTVVIIGLIDYDALTKGLFDLHVPQGVSMGLKGRFPQPQGQRLDASILKPEVTDILYTVPIRTVSAGAELLISWNFDERFSGGPNTSLANAMLAFGIGMTLFTVIFTSFLLSQNKTIRRRVNEATADLSDALTTISSSIDYASHIQRSILPSPRTFGDFFSDHFVIWEPRNVVGGDIYWLRPWGGGKLLLLGDCTGHGVPGAFMTMIATGALDRAQSEVAVGDISALMQRMHQLIQMTQQQEADGRNAQDGMELGVCYFDDKKDNFLFCGARFSLFVAEGHAVREIKGGRKGIGYARVSVDQTYETVLVPVSSKHAYYLTTDGLVDQIGGEKNRSFGKRRFIEAIGSLTSLKFNKQKEILQTKLYEHQGDKARLDDVAVIGFRI